MVPASVSRMVLWLPKTTSGLTDLRRSVTLIAGMIDLLKLLAGVFRSHAAREAEMAFLRHQLLVLQRSAPARLSLRTADRLIFVWLYRLFPSCSKPRLSASLRRWCAGIAAASVCIGVGSRARRIGRPAVPAAIRDLIRTISRDNPSC
jgi:putative transposase